MARAKKQEVVEEAKFTKPTIKQFDTIIRPIITEKTMAMMQNQNKVTVEVDSKANNVQVKLAFEAIFKVKVKEVNIINVKSKEVRRGTRYPGTIPAFKKAIVTLADGQALDLFKE